MGAVCCPPAEQKVETPLLCYILKTEQVAGTSVDLQTQFGIEQGVEVGKLTMLCMPAYKAHSKEDLPNCFPDKLPLSCYEIFTMDSTIHKVRLKDQFGEGTFTVHQANRLCVPVDSFNIAGEQIRSKQYPSHLKTYQIKDAAPIDTFEIYTIDRFGEQKLIVEELVYLMEPALKNEKGELPTGKPLTGYRVRGGAAAEKMITIIDQFNIERAAVVYPVLFCDPAAVIPDSDDECSKTYPNPVIRYDHTDADGRIYIPVENWAAFPNELFRQAPELPPCGSNTNSSRTWVDIYNAEDDTRIYGFCALNSNEGLKRIWFMPSTPKGRVYIIIKDRACDKSYKSNTISFST
jgi:hypothetical protein